MDWSDIAPFERDEFRPNLERVLRNPEIVETARKNKLPRWIPKSAGLWLAGWGLRREFRHVHDVDKFQDVVAKYMREHMVKRTMRSLTHSGLENLTRENDNGFLFISNHRDMMIEPALMNYVLHEYTPLKTAYLTFGDNLLQIPLIADFIKLNKGVTVKRGLKGTAQVREALKLASYSWHLLNQGNSMWYPNREGRAKDGNDFTNPAVIKILYAPHRRDMSLTDYINQANIIPVSFSFEYYPAGVPMAKATYMKELKKMKEDAEASGSTLDTEIYAEIERLEEECSSTGSQDELMAGVGGYKGRVHVAFGKRLAGEFPDVESVAEALNRPIIMNFKIWPLNELAAKNWSGLYKNGNVEDRVRTAIEFDLSACKIHDVQEKFRGIYSNPVANRQRYEQAAAPLGN